MPLPLLIPVVAAASTSSSFGLLTLITSTTLALTSGLAAGTLFNDSSFSMDTATEESLNSLLSDLYNLPEHTEAMFSGMFGDFKKDTKKLVESTKQLSTSSTQLNEVSKTTTTNVQNLQEKVADPLERVSGDLGDAQKSTEELINKLKQYKRAIIRAHKTIASIKDTLKMQAGTIEQLKAEVVPLTKALSVQTKEKEQALENIEILTTSFQQQKVDLEQHLAGLGEVNKRLSAHNRSLENKLALVEADYEITLNQKLAIESFLTEQKNQETVLLQRIKELEVECNSLISGKEVSSAETKKVYEQKISDLLLEQQLLNESLKHQELINTKFKEAILSLEHKNSALEVSLTQFKNDYEGSKKELKKVHSITTSLRADARKQDAVIAAQDELIATLTTGRRSQTAGSLGFFANNAPVTKETASAKPSLGLH